MTGSLKQPLIDKVQWQLLWIDDLCSCLPGLEIGLRQGPEGWRHMDRSRKRSRLALGLLASGVLFVSCPLPCYQHWKAWERLEEPRRCACGFVLSWEGEAGMLPSLLGQDCKSSWSETQRGLNKSFIREVRVHREERLLEKNRRRFCLMHILSGFYFSVFKILFLFYMT